MLFRIKRGLVGYVSYLAACDMNEAFAEYVLYEPILRILTARGYAVNCEFECPGVEQPARGDRKRLDFLAEQDEVRFALEVKWAKTDCIDVERDVEKLRGFRRHFSDPHSYSFLCVFGRKKYVEDLSYLESSFKERGDAVFAEFKTTRYGCRVFELRAPRIL